MRHAVIGWIMCILVAGPHSWCASPSRWLRAIPVVHRAHRWHRQANASDGAGDWLQGVVERDSGSTDDDARRARPRVCGCARPCRWFVRIHLLSQMSKHEFQDATLRIRHRARRLMTLLLGRGHVLCAALMVMRSFAPSSSSVKGQGSSVILIARAVDFARFRATFRSAWHAFSLL